MTAALEGQIGGMLWLLVFVMAPMILPVLVVGLVIGMVQAATSINEMTLSFVPKLLIALACLGLFGTAMLGLLTDFTQAIFETVATVTR
ncbi:MAG: flagellar biosynthetic protein FliQ [Pseudomonadota bacterium]